MVVASTLTERHRQSQLALRADTIRRLSRIWPALDWRNLDQTYPAFVEAVMPLVQQNRARSASLAADYVRAFWAANGLTPPIVVALSDAVETSKVTTSLRVTTLAAAKTSASRGVDERLAMRRSFAQVSGAVSRHVLDGGRETVRRTTVGDLRALGWRRVTRAGACDFCRMLAGRGAVYRGEDTGGFQSHDACGCTAEPVFRDA